MLRVFGIYSFSPKRVAFRNDYCLSCKTPRRAVAIKTVDVAHVLWIPLLPLGSWKRWMCTECGNNPHVSYSTSRTLERTALLCLVVFSIAFWAMPVLPDSVVGTWSIRLGTSLGAILLFLHLSLARNNASLKKALAKIHPASDSACPFCGTPLLMGAQWSCPMCGVVRY